MPALDLKTIKLLAQRDPRLAYHLLRDSDLGGRSFSMTFQLDGREEERPLRLEEGKDFLSYDSQPTEPEKRAEDEGRGEVGGGGGRSFLANI